MMNVGSQWDSQRPNIGIVVQLYVLHLLNTLQPMSSPPSRRDSLSTRLGAQAAVCPRLWTVPPCEPLPRVVVMHDGKHNGRQVH